MKEDLMPGSIICGLDDSESAKRAARVARGLSAHLGLRLVFVHVVDAASPDGKISALAERMHQLIEGADELDCGAAWLVDAGRPADRLVAIAAAEEASLIVVGSRDSRFPVVGSIRGELSGRAPCPVVLVPLGADENWSNGHHHIHEGWRRNGVANGWLNRAPAAMLSATERSGDGARATL